MIFISRKYPPEITRQKIFAWCDKAERCHWDVRNKLVQWLVPSRERESLIADLISSDLLNETRYAGAFVHDKSTFFQWGSNKIISQLKAKGVSERNILEAIKHLDKGETRKTIQKILHKKEPQYKGLQLFQKKIKLTRYLLGKGYEYETISKEVDHYFS